MNRLSTWIQGTENHVDSGQKNTLIPFRDTHYTMNSIRESCIQQQAHSINEICAAHTLLLVTAGRGTIEVNKSQYKLMRGKLWCIIPGTSISLKAEGTTPLHMYLLSFTLHKVNQEEVNQQEWLDKQEPNFDSFFNRNEEWQVKPFQQLESVMEQLFVYSKKEEDREQFFNHFRFQKMMYDLVNQKWTEQKEDPKRAVEHTIQYLNQHFQEQVTIEKLAQMANLSRRWYSALFKELTGKSPSDYITELRIRRAKELLPCEGVTLYEIARQVGFQDEHYFNRRFKKIVGVAPRAFIRNRRYFATSVTYPELLYSLGVTPIAAQCFYSQYPAYLQNSFQDVRILGDSSLFTEGQLQSMNPDLILAPLWRDEGNYEQLSQIASTVLIANHGHWREELRDIGEIVGKHQTAERVIQHYEEKVAKARARLRQVLGDQTVMYLRLTGKELVAYGPGSSRGQMIYEQLALTPLATFPQELSGSSLSLSELFLCNADHIFLHIDQREKDPPARLQQLVKSRQWNELRAVKNKQVHVLNGKEWYNFSFSPLATCYAIDHLVNVFEKKTT